MLNTTDPRFLAALFHIAPEPLSSRRVAELGEGLRLDLPDPLTGDPELPPDLLEGPRPPVGEAEPELDDPPLPIRQGLEDRDHIFLHHAETSGFERSDGSVVLDEFS